MDDPTPRTRGNTDKANQAGDNRPLERNPGGSFFAGLESAPLGTQVLGTDSPALIAPHLKRAADPRAPGVDGTAQRASVQCHAPTILEPAHHGPAPRVRGGQMGRYAGVRQHEHLQSAATGGAAVATDVDVGGAATGLVGRRGHRKMRDRLAWLAHGRSAPVAGARHAMPGHRRGPGGGRIAHPLAPLPAEPDQVVQQSAWS